MTNLSVVDPAALLSQCPEPSGSVVLRSATVLDMTGAPPRPDTTVVVAGDRITAVGPTADTAVPPGASVVDASGRYVIPGLWDMHVHVFETDYLPYFLVNGVTGVRHMGAAPIHFEWREQLRRHELLAPRMVIGSRIVDGPRPLRPHSVAVSGPDDARQAVRDARAAGADFVKVYNLVPRDAYFALADEARRIGMPFGGHVPLQVTVEEAAIAGQLTVEHLEGVLPAASTDAEQLHRELAALEVHGFQDMWAQRAIVQRGADRHDPARAAALYETFVAQGTWHCPTLAVAQAGTYAGTPEFPLTPYLPTIPPDLRRLWEMMGGFERTAEQAAAAERLFERQLQVTGDLHRAGVPLLAGTDTFVPGFSLHDELALLVRAGLDPYDALRAATVRPAEHLGVADDLGTVTPGAVADLLVLDGDPLADVRRTRDVHAVVLGGRLLDATALAALRRATDDATAGR